MISTMFTVLCASARSIGRVVAMIAISTTLLFAASASAQIIDDVLIRADGPDAVARINLNARVRYLRQVPTTAADLVQISFQLIAADDSSLSQVFDEQRKVRTEGGVPAFTVSYVSKPGQPGRQLNLQFSQKVVVQSRQGPNERSIDIVFKGAAAQAAKAGQTLQNPVPVTEQPFAVILQTVPVAQPEKIRPIPAQFQDYSAFNTNSIAGGVPVVEVSIGYFATEAEAEKVRQAALARFPDAKVVDLTKRKQESLQAAAELAAKAPSAPAPVPQPVPTPAKEEAAAAATAPVAVPTPPPVPVPTPPVVAPPVAVVPQTEPVVPAPTPAPVAVEATQPAVQAKPEELSAVEQRADELMSHAREALVAKRYEDAINDLNQILILPPNKYSQEAQELIGVAFERAGQIDKARTEYELYLKLFPDSEGATRVRQRLAAMTETTAPAALTAAAPGTGPEGPGRKLNGSIAQYYYGGKSRSETLVNLGSGLDQATLTKSTESALVTNLDANGRYRTEDSETRLVLRDTISKNFLSTSHSESVLSAAYVDYRNLHNNLQVRAGRQSAVSGGLLGLFDGLSVGYPINQKIKLSAMGGVPANTLVDAPKQRLAAAMLEGDNLYDHFGGSLYVLNQTTEGITDRRAVGAELRFFADRISGYSLLDYDTQFKVLNAATLQGSYQAPDQTTVTVLLDDRKAPSLQVSNALINPLSSSDCAAIPAGAVVSLNDMIRLCGLSAVKDRALSTSATAKQALLSVSRPIGEKWQLSGDVRYAQIGALPQVGNFLAVPATGNQYTYTIQATGSNLYSQRDINGFSLSAITSPTLHGVQFAYNNLTGVLGNKMTIEPSIRLYAQTSTDPTTGDSKLRRITPGLRLTYRLAERASLLGEALAERSKTEGPGTNHDTTTSVFYYVGYRYDM